MMVHCIIIIIPITFFSQHNAVHCWSIRYSQFSFTKTRLGFRKISIAEDGASKN